MGNRSFLAAWSAFALVFFGCSSCGEKRMPASRTEAFAENGRRNLTLIFTGDLMQHMPQVFAARQRDGSFDYTSCFSRLNNYFSSADFVIANLETTLGEEPYSGYPRFRSPEALAEEECDSRVWTGRPVKSYRARYRSFPPRWLRPLH